MNEAQTFLLADQTLSHVIDQIKPDQWSMHMPAWFQAGRTQTDPDLRTIINYHAYDEAWVPDTLAGRTIDQVGTKHDGDLLGQDPAAAYRALRDQAAEAVNAIADLDRPVHLTYGDYPTREYLLHITSFRGFRAYDIAKLIGAPTKLPDELVQGMWDLLSPHAQEWHQMGVYPAAVQVPETASLQDKLVAMSGRQP